MKLKILLLAAILLIIGSTVTVLMVQPSTHRHAQPSQWPTAISNYNQTFKLNTRPPLWPAPQKNGGTNGLPAK
jgi:hypothetical protein